MAFVIFPAVVDSLAAGCQREKLRESETNVRLSPLIFFFLFFSRTVGSDPEFARYVAGVSQAMQQKRQVQQIRRPSNTRSNWPMPDEQHRTWSHPEYFNEGWVSAKHKGTFFFTGTQIKV